MRVDGDTRFGFFGNNSCEFWLTTGEVEMYDFPHDQRGNSRFRLEVPVEIHCRTGELIQGTTLDLSESGIAAIIPLGTIVGETVELAFELPGGPISVRAVVRNKNAFRYGFQFISEPREQEAINRGCRTLAFH